jgi:hypothetical protein
MFSSQVLNIVIAFCAIVVALIAFVSEIRENSRLKFLDNLKFKIAITAIALCIGSWATVMKDKNNAIELGNRDSINAANFKNEVSEISKQNIETYVNALAKYQLYYIESENRVASLIKDSINKMIPDFGFGFQKSNFKRDPNGDSCIGDVGLENKGNCPLTVTLSAWILTESKGILTLIPYRYRLFDEELFSLNQGYTWPISIQHFPECDKLLVRIKGSFKSLGDKRKYPIDDVMAWSFLENKWGTPAMASQRRMVRSLIDTSAWR